MGQAHTARLSAETREWRGGQEVPGGTRGGNTEQRLHQIRTYSDRMGHGGVGSGRTDGTPTGAVSGVEGWEQQPLFMEVVA